VPYFGTTDLTQRLRELTPGLPDADVATIDAELASNAPDGSNTSNP
jgi:hypothetical protein